MQSKTECWTTEWNWHLIERLSEVSGKTPQTIQRSVMHLADVLNLEIPKMKVKKRRAKRHTAVTVSIELYESLKRIAEVENKSVSGTVQYITSYFLKNNWHCE